MPKLTQTVQPKIHDICGKLRDALTEEAGKPVRVAILVWDEADCTWAIQGAPSLQNAISAVEQTLSEWKAGKAVQHG